MVIFFFPVGVGDTDFRGLLFDTFACDFQVLCSLKQIIITFGSQNSYTHS